MALLYPKIRDDLIYQPDPESDERFYVKDPIRHQFFNYNIVKVAMMKALDGRRSHEDIVNVLGEEFGVELPIEQVQRFCARLEREFLLDVTSYRASDPRTRKSIKQLLRRRDLLWHAGTARSHTQEALLFREGLRQIEQGDPCTAAGYFHAVLEMNPSNERARAVLATIHEGFFDAQKGVPSHLKMFHLFNPDRLLTTIDRWLGKWIFSGFGVILIILLLFLGAWAFVDIRWSQYSPSFSDFIVSTPLFWGFCMMHELGHGLACKHYGGTVDDMGMLLIYGVAPGAYCDVNDTYLFKEKTHRIVVLLSGILVGIAFQSLLLLVCLLTSDGFFLRGPLLFTVFSTLWFNVSNLIPLIPLDGYFALGDWLEIQNLRERSFRFMRERLAKWLLGVAPVDPEPTRRERYIFLIYGTVGGIYTVAYIYGLWISFLLPLAIRHLHAIGLLISIYYFASLLGRRILGALIALGRFVYQHRRDVFTVPRTIGYAVVCAGVTFALCAPWPFYLDGQMTVLPNERAVIFATENGVIDRVAVKEGSVVHKGDVLANLRDDDLSRSRAEAAADLEQAKIKLRLLQAGARREELDSARSLVHASVVARQFTEREAARVAAMHDASLATDVEERSSEKDAKLAVSDEVVADRSLSLLEKGARPEDLAQASAEVEKLEARIAKIDEQLARLVLRSPIDGVVIGWHLDELVHKRLARGDALCEVHDLSRVRPEVRLASWEPLTNLRVGFPVRVRAYGDPDHELRAIVERILPSTSKDDTRVAVALAAIENPGWATGMTGHGRVYCPPRSVAYRFLGVPLLQIFDYSAWRIWG